jgi:hypothetical protein
MVVQVVVETATVGLRRVGGELALVAVPLVALGATAWMHATREETAGPARPASSALLSAGAAALVVGLLALPWVAGVAEAGFMGSSLQPWGAYAGFRLTLGALTGALALAAAGALLAARQGRLPVAFAALAFLGAALAALVPFLGVTVCTFEFLSSACLADPEPQPAAGVAAAVSFVAAASLAMSLRRDAPESVK